MSATVYHAGKFPPARLDWQRLIPLVGPAHAALAQYEALRSAFPNARKLLAPMTTQEAVLSSRIEGTQATMTEVLQFEAGGDAGLDVHKREDIREVLNYRRAMQQATERLQDLPLCNRLIRQLHATLMQGVRGSSKAPGQFRAIQNSIAAPGRSMEQARFIPIEPNLLPDAMGRWETYLHSPEQDVLVQLALIHAEFEAIHPFLDGNGRIGRMLIPPVPVCPGAAAGTHVLHQRIP